MTNKSSSAKGLQQALVRKCSRGFSLLEVLIAVLVIAFGVLGMAALQLKSLQFSHSGYQRTIASVIALDAAEQLWVKKVAKVMGVDEDNNPVQLNVPVSDIGVAITNRHSAMLPSLNVNITNVANRYTIVVSWAESRFVNENGNSFTYVVDIYP